LCPHQRPCPRPHPSPHQHWYLHLRAQAPCLSPHPRPRLRPSPSRHPPKCPRPRRSPRPACPSPHQSQHLRSPLRRRSPCRHPSRHPRSPGSASHTDPSAGSIHTHPGLRHRHHRSTRLPDPRRPAWCHTGADRGDGRRHPRTGSARRERTCPRPARHTRPRNHHPAVEAPARPAQDRRPASPAAARALPP
jgi:hypothetical protein